MRFMAAAICLLAPALTGCGNQMLRQPGYRPLDSPRAMPPVGTVPVAAALAPSEARGYAAAGADPGAAAAESDRGQVLPPPNLSDNARNEPTPPQVNAISDPLPASYAVISAGKTQFLNRCVQCHQPGGWGYGPVGAYLLPHPPDLASALVQKRSDGAIYWHITMGQGKMPGFRHWTTAGQRWELVRYVRSLRGRDPQAAPVDTREAPYPVYGQGGFEDRHGIQSYRVVPAEPEIRRNLAGTQLFGSGARQRE